MPMSKICSIATVLGLICATTAAHAFPPDLSLRPVARPGGSGAEPSSDIQVSRAVVLFPGTSLRPRLRPETPRQVAVAKPEPKREVSVTNPGLTRWIKEFRSRALKQGISGATFDRAFRSVGYNTEVIRRDSNQAEFTKTIWQYLDSAASDKRIRNGKEALARHRRTLERIEARYGVDKEVVTAVWGLESAYGVHRGKMPIIESLATLAYDGRRGKFFEAQLIAALKILQSGDTTPARMTGSWAGAMGHTQFMPTSYLDYAVDFTGDGRRDIWSDDPTDALASTAAYLARHGWVKGQPWGVEVRLPRNFDYDLARRSVKRMPSDWARLGVKGMNGRAVQDYGSASILLPAGAKGAAFMIFKNFAVIERYNAADAYVIGVGHLSDRIKGKGPIRASWPKDDRGLTFSERKEMQRRLTGKGFSTRGVDGRIGPQTQSAIKAYQRSKGRVPDGYPSITLLKSLRK